MTGTISSLLSNTFSALGGSTKSQSATDSGKATTLADVLNESKSSDAFVLSLSDEAQKQLAAARQKLAGTKTDSDEFTLNPSQQASYDAIMEKYKELPLNDANYEALQHDLYDAGIAPEQLSMLSKVSNFNSTQALMDAMNGIYTDPSDFMAGFGQPDETKTDNYLNKIVQTWSDAQKAAVPVTEPDDADDAAAPVAENAVVESGGNAG